MKVKQMLTELFKHSWRVKLSLVQVRGKGGIWVSIYQRRFIPGSNRMTWPLGRTRKWGSKRKSTWFIRSATLTSFSLVKDRDISGWAGPWVTCHSPMARESPHDSRCAMHGQPRGTQTHRGPRPAQPQPLPCKKGRGPRPKGCCDIWGALEGLHSHPLAMPTNHQSSVLPSVSCVTLDKLVRSHSFKKSSGHHGDE